MSIFSLFSRKKNFFSPEEQERIVEEIRLAEKETSGEIRIFVESKNRFMDPLDRAKEIFFDLKMQNTQERNAVLLYIAMDDHELALFADEGIYKRTGPGYWDNAVRNMIGSFTKDNISNGIQNCIRQVGETLRSEFPYNINTDKNELPDQIIFGK